MTKELATNIDKIVEDNWLKEPKPVSLNPVMDALLSLAKDPAFKPETLQALIAMQERSEERQAKISFQRDFAAALLEMPHVLKRSAKDMGEKGRIAYANYEDVDAMVRPVEAKYGFARSFRTAPSTNGINMICVLAHRDGHCEQSEMQLPADPGPGRNAIQAIGSSHSYARRYLTLDLWNIVTKGMDDDGHNAGVGLTITEEQSLQIRDLLREAESDGGANYIRFKKWLKESTGAITIEAIPSRFYADVVRKLEQKKGGAK